MTKDEFVEHIQHECEMHMNDFSEQDYADAMQELADYFQELADAAAGDIERGNND